ncbi:dTDP-4-amino-4,6-dideoxygalactose transaminase [Sulfurovum sp. ST-21]|uniref:dTDP-4-amino-4,6-dideoxygalactose transaminase n=1 Tax=Sulfurovum indicum TaxID=2779528 RepID=A0A7M1S458_9BACT|nr:dTDP-4-amino-4,6-dideoxygalactose transaminase [Sulfurovum indicum]QOR62203.1 dTDP-4-amino-4,6-dideoxygalactose transaminase [Sulfurovum indicum]
MIPFNQPPYIGTEDKYVLTALKQTKIAGDGFFAKKCQKWFEEKTGASIALLTTSCTHALEMSALLINLKEGDEVIMPSYTFVSTANAFALRGAKIIFVDIRPDTMNIDETKIEAAITSKTKAIIPVHYAGVACEMDTIMEIADRYNLIVIEDAAQGMMSTYKDKPLGTIGHIGTYSFHETKNYTSGGEGGVIFINDEKYFDHAEIIREKGTNRNQFFRGQVDKYTWVELGSSYLPCELQAAYLYAQLLDADKINHNRLASWYYYYQKLTPLAQQEHIELPYTPKECQHNAHMFYIKTKNLQERTALLAHLEKNQVGAVFHYVPLHSSDAGLKFGKFNGEDTYTTIESERIIRLPMFYNLNRSSQDNVIETIYAFFHQ